MSVAIDSDSPGLNYRLEGDGAFVIDQFDLGPAFSSFLPAVAGPDGAPLWCMIANRGQAVAGFGVHDKNSPIQEFLSARAAYQQTALQGFRTFLTEEGYSWEPFGRRCSGEGGPLRRMRIEPHAVALEEVDEQREVTVRVRVFSPAHRKLAGLVRRFELRNDAGVRRTFRIADGLAVMVPATVNDYVLKHMRRMTEAFARVKIAEGVACFSPPASTGDSAEVKPVTERTFAAFYHQRGDRLESVIPVIDPDVVFGPDADLVEAGALIANGGLADREAQVYSDRLPCAFSSEEVTLEPGDSVVFHQVYGHAPREGLMVEYLQSLQTPTLIEQADRDGEALVKGLTAPALTVSSERMLDEYARQNFLDNVLRGGTPVLLPSADGDQPIWLYTRRHGDMERDYNFFIVPARPLSEGAGNFRDVCQNRRHYAWFYQGTAEADLRLFCELLQADGYNPLSVEGWRWRAPAGLDAAKLFPGVSGEPMDELGELLGRAFSPGELAQWIQWNSPEADALEKTREILGTCTAHVSAEGHEGGYWVDHWIYLNDLVLSYLGVYPDKAAKFLTEETCGWWEEGVNVLPRAKRATYSEGRWVQNRAIVDAEKCVELPRTSLYGKLAAHATLKAMTLDPEGRGVEMEAGRPGWNDAMNGLPGMFGSSVRETGATADLCALLMEVLPEGADCMLPAPAASLVRDAAKILGGDGAYPYAEAADRREAYRAALRSDEAAEAVTVTAAEIKAALKAALRVTGQGVQRAVNSETGLLDLYHVRDSEAPAPSGNGSAPGKAPDASEMKARPLPPFLEGQVALLRRTGSAETARANREAVRKSGLFDERLNMYKTNASLAGEPFSIGRARTFSRGWYENESVWTHMAYKYLLELLRSGAAAEFFEDAQTMLVPFMDPKVYGRSPLENSSFIASSACPDSKSWGRGFVARLSGATAEFIHFWILMTSGERPFRVDSGELQLRLEPVLPSSWFTHEERTVEFAGREEVIPANCFAFTFLNRALVVYHNGARRNTFGPAAVRPASFAVDGGEKVDGAVLSGDLAERVRRGDVRRIDVTLA